ncbi:hydrogenase 4, membrane subunit [Candidatus Sulfotelmatobacter kueseliae]|uniref:Hydrogenase 4, membrane subunit n=1 Tax=Candidatus Sulfotelmatobacter kueseliae TaxID=2042962 RepID=A0A2U3L7K7_9BACT|nr:hydrogenase 4, membrane subunit [Candidatus Sulfotelmatobacter kueseliae]
MNPERLHTDLIETLSLTLVITSVAAVEMRRLKFSIIAYLCQALLIVALLLSFASVNHALYWWAATALVTKAILTPWFLFRAIRGVDDRELKPVIGFGPSVVIVAVLMITFFRLAHGKVALLAPTGLAQLEVFRTNLAVASTVFALGLYAVLTRRDAIKTVIGLCLLENGVHLSLVSLAPGLSETALFGVATEVVVTVFLLLYVIGGVRQVFGTTDTFRLRELRW